MVPLPFKTGRPVAAGWKSRPAGLLLALALLAAFAGPASGQTTWTGGSHNLNWNDPGNWSAGVPTTGTDVVLTNGPPPPPPPLLTGNVPNNYDIPVAIQLRSITLNDTAVGNLNYNIALTGAGVTPGLQSGGTITDKNGNNDMFRTGLTLNGPATITAAAGDGRSILRFNNPITGTGPLTLVASADMISLSAVNTYTGATIVNAGIPLGVNAVVNGAVPTTSALTVNAGGSIEFFAANNTIGSLAGAGTVGLNTANLTVGADNTSTTFSGVIADVFGANSLIKIGTGTLTLTGTNTYTGATIVNGGTLVVNGSIATSSLTTVNVAGTLAGTGTVGPTAVNGTISPGPLGGIGTLNVAGAFTQNAGSTFLTNLAGTASNRLQITGAATLNGGTVVVNGAGKPDTVYPILTAAGGRSGVFAGVTDNDPFTNAVLLYDGNNVYVLLVPSTSPVPVANFLLAIPTTFNQMSVASALTGPGASVAYASVIETLAGFSADQVRFTLDQLSGEVYASALSAGIENQALWLRTLAQQVRLANRCLCPETSAGDATGCDDGGRWRTWATPFGMAGLNHGDGNAHAFTYDSVGFAAGGDRRLDSDGNALIGFATGYSNWNNRTNLLGSSTSANAFNFAGYARAQLGQAWLLGITSYEFDGYSSVRPMDLLGATAFGRFNGNQIGEYLEAGYALNLGGLQLQPLGAVQYISIWRNSVQESGAGTLDLNVAGAQANSFRTQFGGRLLYPITSAAQRCILPEVGAYWIHEYAQVSREDENQLAGDPQFASKGANLGRDYGLFTLGVSTQMGQNLRASVYYMNYVTPSAVAHGGMAQLQLAW